MPSGNSTARLGRVSVRGLNTVGIKLPFDVLAGMVAQNCGWLTEDSGPFYCGGALFDSDGGRICDDAQSAGAAMNELGWFMENTASRHIMWELMPHADRRATAVRAALDRPAATR